MPVNSVQLTTSPLHRRIPDLSREDLGKVALVDETADFGDFLQRKLTFREKVFCGIDPRMH